MDPVIILSSDDDDDLMQSAVIKPPKVTPSPMSYEFEDDTVSFVFGVSGSDDIFSPQHNQERRISTSLPSTSTGGSTSQQQCVSSVSVKSSCMKARRPVHELSDSAPSDDDTKQNTPEKYSSSDDDFPRLNLNTECYKQASDVVVQKMRKTKVATSSKDDVKRQTREEQRIQKQLLLQEKTKQREAAREERERKKKEAAHAKALKQVSAEVEKSRKPGECQKWVTAIVDPGLLNADYSGEMLTAFRSAEIDYKIEDCIIPCSIAWERRVLSVQDDSLLIQKTSSVQKENNVLIVWMWNKIIEQIHDGILQCTIDDLMSLLPDCELTIVTYGLEDYFRYQKTQKSRDVRSEILGTVPRKNKTKEASYNAAPRVSRGDVEVALAEIQVKWNVCHRCINSKADLANLVCQFTKAIAEAPFKRQNMKIDADRLGWYASGDSHDCVIVDKDGNGSLQLWQRQLCQFPLASRETSEAITSVYPSPVSLLKAYDKCSNEEEAQGLLQDIPVRRGPGPLSSVRRIGPQLSKKIHTFFTTTDEFCLISPD